MSLSTPPNPNEQAQHRTGEPDEEFRKRLADEYKILQDKIDKIGAFRFTIKGWSVTVVIAASAASASLSGLAGALGLSVGVVIMLLFFFFMELEQVKLSDLFGDRAQHLEKGFIRLDRKRRSRSLLFPSPFIANEIASASRGDRVIHSKGLTRVQEPPTVRQRMKDGWTRLRRTHVYFYVVLCFLGFSLPLIPRHAAIQKQWKALATRETAKPAHATESNRIAK